MTTRLTNNEEPTAAPTPPGRTLLSHQQEGIRFAVNRLRTNRGAMFGDVMGTRQNHRSNRNGQCHWAQPHLGRVPGKRPVHVAA